MFGAVQLHELHARVTRQTVGGRYQMAIDAGRVRDEPDALADERSDLRTVWREQHIDAELDPGLWGHAFNRR